MLRQRLIDRDATKGGNADGQQATAHTTIGATASLAITQGKDALVIIQPEATTTSDFDSAIGGAVSLYTRSSRASQSDFEFSESYL